MGGVIGKSEEELKANAGNIPASYLFVFLCGLGFAGATSFGTAQFSGKPKALWLIDSGFNLVAFVIAGVILATWRS